MMKNIKNMVLVENVGEDIRNSYLWSRRWNFDDLILGAGGDDLNWEPKDVGASDWVII